MRQLVGLDYGDARIGVAFGDETARIAVPHSVIPHRGWGPSARAVRQLMDSFGASAVVLGLPCGMDGGVGDQAREVLGFAEVLKKQGISVILQDERLSSFEAEERLRAQGKDARQVKALVDQVAAAIILQTYLDKQQASM